MEEQRKRNVLVRGEQLRLVSVTLFCVGLYVADGIYIQIGANVVLLCGTVTITPELAKKLNVIAHAGNAIYVKAAEYDGLEEQYEAYIATIEEMDVPDKLTQEEIDIHVREFRGRIEQVEVYQEITGCAKDMMRGLLERGEFSDAQASSIAADILQSLELSESSIILQCVNNIRDVDDYLYSHSTNVAMLNGLFGQWLEYTEEAQAKLIKIGLLHDVGKLKIPDEILNKPARLTEEEFAIIRQHSAHSEKILRDSGIEDDEILNGVLYHHERMNGTGYPAGLPAAEIPMFAKITAISDVYDAMVAKRVYKDRHPPFDILKDFSESRFSDLDYQLVTVFLKNMPRVYLNKETLLSDSRIGRILYVGEEDIGYPIVEVAGELIKTTDALKCMTVSDFMYTSEGVRF